MDQDDVKSKYAAISALLGENKHNEALMAINELDEDVRESPHFQYLKAHCLVELGSLNRAVELLENLRDKFPDGRIDQLETRLQEQLLKGPVPSRQLTPQESLGVARAKAAAPRSPLAARCPNGDLQTQVDWVLEKVASRLKAKRLWKKAVRFKPRHVTNARAGFAAQMKDDEKPLLFLRQTFLGGGRHGLLVTNRAVYSSYPVKRMSLKGVRKIAVWEAPKNSGENAYLAVNGERFHKGPAAIRAKRVLQFFASAIRELRDLPFSIPPTERVQELRDYETLSAAGIAAGQEAEDITDVLVDEGMSPDRAEQLVKQMTEKLGPSLRKKLTKVQHSIPPTFFGLLMAVSTAGWFFRAEVMLEDRTPENLTLWFWLPAAIAGLAAIALVWQCVMLFIYSTAVAVRGTRTATEEILKTWDRFSEKHVVSDQ